MKTLEIEKNVNVHFIKETKFNTIGISILIRAKLSREFATANMLLLNILKSSCKNYKNIVEINKKTEEMYGAYFNGQVVKKNDEQILQLYLEVVEGDKFVLEGLKFLKEILLNPNVDGESFNEEMVETQKIHLENHIKNKFNNKFLYTKEKLVEAMYDGQAYGIKADGYIEDLKGITGKDLYKLYLRHIKHSPLEFIIVGNLKENEAINNIKRYFDLGIKREKFPIKDRVLTVNTTKKKIIVEERGNNLTYFFIGFKTHIHRNDFYILLVLKEILEANLFNVLREREALCYRVSSQVITEKETLIVGAIVNPENYEKALKIINNEIKKLSSGELNSSMLNSAKNLVVERFNVLDDKFSTIIDFNMTQFIMNDKYKKEDIISKINQISLRDIEIKSKKIVMDKVYKLNS